MTEQSKTPLAEQLVGHTDHLVGEIVYGCNACTHYQLRAAKVLLVETERQLAAAQAENTSLKRRAGALEQVAGQAELQQKALNQSAQAEIAALREDAERYRWLRDYRSVINFDLWPGGYKESNYFPDNLDAAIDAARKEQP